MNLCSGGVLLEQAFMMKRKVQYVIIKQSPFSFLCVNTFFYHMYSMWILPYNIKKHPAFGSSYHRL